MAEYDSFLCYLRFKGMVFSSNDKTTSDGYVNSLVYDSLKLYFVSWFVIFLNLFPLQISFHTEICVSFSGEKCLFSIKYSGLPFELINVKYLPKMITRNLHKVD